MLPPPRPRGRGKSSLEPREFPLRLHFPQPCDAAFQLPYRISRLAALDIGRPAFFSFRAR